MSELNSKIKKDDVKKAVQPPPPLPSGPAPSASTLIPTPQIGRTDIDLLPFDYYLPNIGRQEAENILKEINEVILSFQFEFA